MVDQSLAHHVEDEHLDALLREAERTLTEARVWSPREDAEALAAHVLGLPGGSPEPAEQPVSAAAAAELRALVARRAARIPLGHLTGRARLGGIEVTVTEDVFVPRFPTELLLAWGLSAVREKRAPVVVDLCTGSGALALAFAHARPDAEVHAVDLDPAALACARRNAAARAAAGDTPVTVHAGDVTDPELLAAFDGRVDLVLANPPYVPVGTELLPEWGEHHPRQAVFAGADGLDVIRAVVDCAARLLRDGGGLAIEHGDAQADVVPGLLAGTGAFAGTESHRDQEDRPRSTTTYRTADDGSRSMTTTSTAEAGLAGLRAELDQIDVRLLDTLRARIECCVQIAEHKREHAVPMMQPHRIGIVQERAARYGAEHGVDRTFLRRLYDLIIEETCRVEDLVIGGEPAARQSATGDGS
ncbi:peptide chain release factor N(5)-glutamine methyltransferase [Streptomyces sp. NPDC007157]|uniref:peptide chain release factor N(5)-glutamine methyltransferase n=1 Tax=Streptomyces sp. NPDC007157 TaxID=3154681 RepID=UPI0033C1DA4E